MIREHYQSKEKRDARYKELQAQGVKCKRSCSRGSLLHPQYVKDFEGPEKYDIGLGNTVYKTCFPNLYTIEEIIK